MILSCVMGKEHKKICGFLLGLIINLPVPSGIDSSCVVKAVCALLDFLFLAQFQSHTSDTLSWLEDSLVAFHNNKAVFVDLSIQEDFNIPKLHGLLHYALSIRLFGTTDNYNTEQSEHLHINLAKNAYCATNHKDKYSQITMWLECYNPGPYFSFSAFPTYSFHVLSHSFPTCSLTCCSDQYPVT